LKREQDINAHLDRIRKNMDQTIKVLQKGLDEAERDCPPGQKANTETRI
jgi:hypothetical protein